MSKRAPTGQGPRRAGAHLGHTPPRRARSRARGFGVGTRWQPGHTKRHPRRATHSVPPTPRPDRPAPAHTRRRPPHQVHDATARRNQPQHTRGTRGTRASTTTAAEPPTPPGGGAGGVTTPPPPPPSPTHANKPTRDTTAVRGGSTHVRGAGTPNPQDTVGRPKGRRNTAGSRRPGSGSG